MARWILGVAAAAIVVVGGPLHADEYGNALAIFGERISTMRGIVAQEGDRARQNSMQIDATGSGNIALSASLLTSGLFSSGMESGIFRQEGDGNELASNVLGDANQLSLHQLGDMNRVNGIIRGSGNIASISQAGTGNVISFNQTGTGNLIVLSQGAM